MVASTISNLLHFNSFKVNGPRKHAFMTKISFRGAVSLLASAAILLAPVTASADPVVLPTGGQVVDGSAMITQDSATSLLIDQASSNAIIHYDSFSIGQGNSVHISNGSGSTLNRVTGSYISKIDGSLTATGNVLLINPNGVIVGREGAIDTGGSFLASTRDVSNGDFLNGGDLTFFGDSDAEIVNLGHVNSQMGDVAFFAHKVTNEGTITADNGTAALAAGVEILLRDSTTGDGKVFVKAGKSGNSVSHSGIIRAANAELRAHDGNVYALAGNNGGSIQVTGATSSGGRVFLNGGSGTVQVTQKVRASKKTVRQSKSVIDGGAVFINAGFASLGDIIDVDGAIGGSVAIKADTLSLAEPVYARGTEGHGGSIDLDIAGDSLVFQSGLIDVSGYTDGGDIRHVTARTLTHSGQYLALGETGQGGTIDIGGGATRLLSPLIDASGATGGGRIRIGGEYQGGKDLAVDELPNTLRLAVTDATTIRADASGDHGDGGQIILWADEKATILGQISARPGAQSGDGGFIELSAGDNLSALTSAVTTAAADGTRGGTILLDPRNITIDQIADVDQSIFILGSGYIFRDVAQLEVGDSFGQSVSLDGNRLAVGANLDDGAGNAVNGSGAVYLFTFTDASFSGGSLSATIGNGYTGGNNVNVSQLEAGDQFGSSISLDGNRLAVGTWFDAGATNALSNSGAVYLFTFTDTSFSGGSLAATIGNGYTGSNNLNLSQLDANDKFGFSVSLDGNRLAVGAIGDYGAGNAVSNSGAVYLFTFADDSFAGGSLAATIGNGYTGSNNVNLSQVADGDGFGSSVSLDGNRLAVGAYNDSGAGDGVYFSGAVYLFTFSDASFSGGSLAAAIGNGYTGSNDVNLTQLDIVDRFGTSVSLDGNRLAVGSWEDDGATNTVSGSGAVYLFTFSDADFTGGSHVATMGNGYTGGNNVNLSQIEAYDIFGWSVSLDGNRLAVGAASDDGAGNALSNSGAVYLFTFSDASFSGGSLAATVGNGYSAGNNVDVSQLEVNDFFGSSVSLDGTRLAVGAWGDDGAGNAVGSRGAVYLFTFSDANFTGGSLAATIGNGYTGSNNVNLSQLEAGDRFGSSVSLDGNRLAVGTAGDYGAGNLVNQSGAVYLFTFSDASFTGGSLAATIGNGYTGSNNVDLSQLETSDQFGNSVSLDGNRLAVGAALDDGVGNAVDGSGAVYLFTFSDASFTGGSLAATIGNGYTGGDNVDLSQLEATDIFGISVSLDGNRLAVGASLDDGASNAVSGSGAVYLFTFSDTSFTGGSLVATIGSGYTGSNNVNLGQLETSDSFGISVSLDGNRLAVGAYEDDGAIDAVNDSGAVYLFTFSDASFTGGILAATIGNGYSAGNNVDLSQLEASDKFGYSVSLDGNRLAVGARLDDGAGNAVGGSGAVYLFTFSDASFNGGSLVATIGNGYTGGNNINVSQLGGGDFFGNSVSLDGNRLAVGALSDDGFGDALQNGGAVYLFTFSDASFSGGSLAATIGDGYTGGNNFNLSQLELNDYFGSSVSLDGNRLAVGAWEDEGVGNALDRSGAVYLFTFADADFGGGSLAATIGNGYTGSNNIDVSQLEALDRFGSSVSLDGNRLAVGAYGDYGAGNAVDVSGAVYLFTFSDESFTGGSLAATIGDGYTSGNNVDLSQLDAFDFFGTSVSLDGNRLAVGAHQDDGVGNAVGASGAVYLFTFSDESFSGGSLAATIGDGYTGGNNFNLSQLDANDLFGWSVSLDGNRLAVGARGDAGATNTVYSSGAVYLFTFSDASFSGGSHAVTLGKGYSGGNHIDVSHLDSSDRFGISVSLDGNRLAVGAFGDFGASNAAQNTGAVYLFTNVFGPTLVTDAVFATNPGDDITIDVDTLTSILDAGNNVILQANNDIFFNTALTANNGAGNGGALSALAGRSILINADISTDNGNLTLIGNELLANGVVDGNRDAGDAVIVLADGVNLDAGSGVLTLEVRDGTGKTNKDAGDITFAGNNQLSGASISLHNLGVENDNAITFGTGSQLIASGSGDAIEIVGDIFTNNAGSGLFSFTGGGRALVFSKNTANDTRGGVSGLNLYNHTYGSALPTIVTGSTDNWFISEFQPTLTLTGTDTTVTYSGSSQTLSGFTVAGLVNGDSQAQALTTNPTLGGQTNASTYTSGNLSGGASAIGYAISLAQGTLIIEKKTLSVAGAGTVSRMYDGTTDATVVAGNFTLSGFVGSEIATVTKTSGSYNDKDVDDANKVTVTLAAGDFGDATSSGFVAGNYALPTGAVIIGAGGTGTAEITTKALSIAGAGTVSRMYDGTTDATVVAGNFTLSGFVGSEIATVTKTSGSYNDKDVDDANKVTVTLAAGDFGDATSSGFVAGNYAMPTGAVIIGSGGTGTAEITTKALSVAGAGTVSRIYDGSVDATLVAGNFTLSGFIGSEIATVTKTTGAYNDKDVADANKVTVTLAAGDFGDATSSGFVAGNYAMPTGAVIIGSGGTGTAEITTKALSVAGAGTVSRIYDGSVDATLVAGNFSLSGFIGSEIATVTKTTGAYNDKDVADANKVTVTLAAGDFSDGTASGFVAGNYALPTGAVIIGAGGTGTAEITTKALSVAGAGTVSRMYDGSLDATVVAGNFTLSGFVGSEIATVTKTTGTYNDKDVDDANKVTVTLAAGDFGDATSSGFVAGNYALPTGAVIIGAGGTGTAEITTKALSVAGAGTVSRMYDGTTDATVVAGNFTLSGFVGSEIATVTKTTGSYNDKDVADANQVTVTLAVGDFGDATSSGFVAGNYALPTGAVIIGTGGTGTAAITTKALSVAGAGTVSRMYDGSLDATVVAGNFTLSGFVGSEIATVTKTTGTYNDKDVADANKVTVTLAAGDFGDATSSGFVAGNYALPTGAVIIGAGGTGTAEITTKALSVAGAGTVSKIYDGSVDATLVAGNFSLSGFIGSEIATVTKTTGAYNDKDVADANQVTVTLAPGDFSDGTASGFIAGNYAPLTSNVIIGSGSTGTAEITIRALSVTADAGQSKSLGDTDPVFTFTSVGLFGGDSLAGQLSRDAGETVGPYNLLIGTLTASTNYNLGYVGNTFEIVVPVESSPTPPAPTETNPITEDDTGGIVEVFEDPVNEEDPEFIASCMASGFAGEGCEALLIELSSFN